MDSLLELGGVWLARAYAIYGLVFLLVPAFFFADLLLLAAVVWAVAGHSRGRQPWPYVPAFARRWVRLAVEIAFGLINPVLYLAILTPALPAFSFPDLRSGATWWLVPLTTSAWLLLTAFWTLRLCGAALDPRSRAVRAGVRMLLLASLACVLLYTVKDAWLVGDIRPGTDWRDAPQFWLALNVLRLCPLYLIPAVLLWDYLRSTATSVWQVAGQQHGLFLLPNRAARGAHRRRDRGRCHACHLCPGSAPAVGSECTGACERPARVNSHGRRALRRRPTAHRVHRLRDPARPALAVPGRARAPRHQRLGQEYAPGVRDEAAR